MFNYLVIILILTNILAIFSQEETKCVTLNDNDIRSLFDQWNAALQSCDPEKVVAMYWDHSIFVPNFQNDFNIDAASKIAYYTNFLQSKPKASIVEDYIDLTGCNQAQYNGVYNLHLTDPLNGVESDILSRFSFTFQTYDTKYWAIKTHHVSKMPNDLSGGGIKKRRLLRVKSSLPHPLPDRSFGIFET